MALELLAAQGGIHGRLPRGGEIAEWTERRIGSERATDTAARLLERFAPLRSSVPASAWYSGSIALDPHMEDRDRYKTIDGKARVPTQAFASRNDAEFAATLLRLADLVAAKQRVLAVTLRVGIPPRGFYAVHGDGVVAGPRANLLKNGAVEVVDKKGRRRVASSRLANLFRGGRGNKEL